MKGKLQVIQLGWIMLVTLAVGLVGCASQPSAPSASAPVTIRFGYFPNITHAQAVIGIADGTFARALGDSVKIDAKLFNAGPSAIEAMFAGQLDLTYIGPNPAINGYVKSKGAALRIIASRNLASRSRSCALPDI